MKKLKKHTNNRKVKENVINKQQEKADREIEQVGGFDKWLEKKAEETACLYENYAQSSKKLSSIWLDVFLKYLQETYNLKTLMKVCFTVTRNVKEIRKNR